MTALSQIFAAIDGRLAALPTVQSYERMPSGDPDVFPALAAFDDGDEPAEQEAGSTRLSLSLTVEGYMNGVGGAATHNQLLALHAAVVLALCGDEGTNLGGLIENIEIVGRRRIVVAELAKERRLSFGQDFEITYSTIRGDPASFA
jgi:hypothetical protein